MKKDNHRIQSAAQTHDSDLATQKERGEPKAENLINVLAATQKPDRDSRNSVYVKDDDHMIGLDKAIPATTCSH